VATLDRVIRLARAVRRWSAGAQAVLTAGAVLGAMGIALALVQWPQWVPPGAFLPLMLVAALLLRLRSLVVVAVVELVLLVTLRVGGVRTIVPGTITVGAITALALVAFAWDRERVGLRGAPGDRMLVDLRDRLAAHGRVPPLPDGWRVDSEIRAAHADAFSGDFMVAGLHDGSLEIVLVDVSGKGQDAGVRSLQLSGALGGLLGAMPREQFLRAANGYLLDQDWDEGFATAIHVQVNLRTGEYLLSSAGHPPAVHLHAGSGRLAVVDTVGSPALGVVADLEYTTSCGRLDPGDVLMLYTDGLVEARGSDVDRGLDRLMGVAEQVLGRRRGGAAAVLSELGAADTDDRALVLVRRD